MEQFPCQICETKFSQKKNLYAHERKFHGRALEGTIQCLGCEIKVLTMKGLLKHVGDEHKVVMDTCELSFNSNVGKCIGNLTIALY